MKKILKQEIWDIIADNYRYALNRYKGLIRDENFLEIFMKEYLKTLIGGFLQ